ncbi:hypothetical protein MHYP_G00017300 [Metynnis hypsauchen]
MSSPGPETASDDNEPQTIDSEPEPLRLNGAAADRSSDEAEMIIKFNVAYNIAEELPFAEFKSEMTLQKKNGLNAAADRSSDEAEMIIKFNVAYNIAEELPFAEFKSEMTLQKKNGLNVNPTYSYDVACARFIGVIADSLKKRRARPS